jgi:hypothetical protein
MIEELQLLGAPIDAVVNYIKLAVVNVDIEQVT